MDLLDLQQSGVLKITLTCLTIMEIIFFYRGQKIKIYLEIIIKSNCFINGRRSYSFAPIMLVIFMGIITAQSGMYPIIPKDGENTVTHNTLGKEKINPDKIFDQVKKNS